MSRNRVQRVKPVWRVFWDQVGTFNVMSASAGAESNASHDLVTAAEVEDLDDNCLLKRIVGEISFFFLAADGGSAVGMEWFRMGILVEDEQYANTTFQLSSAADAQDGAWMFLRTYYGGGTAISNEGGNAMQPLTDGGGLLSTHLDVKVARKLLAGSALRLKLIGRAETVAWNINYSINLRMLIEA